MCFVYEESIGDGLGGNSLSRKPFPHYSCFTDYPFSLNLELTLEQSFGAEVHKSSLTHSTCQAQIVTDELTIFNLKISFLIEFLPVMLDYFLQLTIYTDCQLQEITFSSGIKKNQL